MKLYFAGAESFLNLLANSEVENILISIANGEKAIPKVPLFFKKYDLIIDSGAFTFKNKGGIKLETWIEKVLALKNISNHIINLDVIGDPKKSYENYLIIKRYIPDVVPVFHFESDIELLKNYLNYNDYIAIGNLVGKDITKVKPFLNNVFKLFNKNNLPKFHAFGVNTDAILTNYPFYSCDASTWLMSYKYNVHRYFKNGKISRKLCLSELKNANTDKQKGKLEKEHFLTPEEKTILALKEYGKYEKHLTDLWNKRGINFK